MRMNMEKEVRILEVYAVAVTLVAALIFLSGSKLPEKKAKFSEIDVERINVVEKNGKLDLVISNKSRLPDPIVNGKAMKRSGDEAGMIFYNDEGDENGGIGFGGGKTKDGYQAGGDLMFDQYKQDQTIGILYEDSNGKRRAGLQVWDRPDMSLEALSAKIDAIRGMKAGPEKDAAMQKLKEEAKHGAFGVTRLFAGKLPDKSTDLVLSDPEGRPRLTIAVDADGNPKLSFLDDSGKVTYQLPPNPHP